MMTKALTVLLFLLTSPTLALSATQVHSHDSKNVCLIGVDLNQANTDYPMSIVFPNYIAQEVTVMKASTTLAASPATLGLFSQPNGGGVAAIPLTTVQALNSTTRFAKVSLGAFTVVASLPTVYFRVGTPHGSPATLNVCLTVMPVP